MCSIVNVMHHSFVWKYYLIICWSAGTVWGLRFCGVHEPITYTDVQCNVFAHMCHSGKTAWPANCWLHPQLYCAMFGVGVNQQWLVFIIWMSLLLSVSMTVVIVRWCLRGYPAILSCPVISYPVLSHPILCCPVLSFPVLSFPVLPFPVQYCPGQHRQGMN